MHKLNQIVTKDPCAVCGAHEGFVLEMGATLKREAKCANCGAALRSSDLLGALSASFCGSIKPIGEVWEQLADRVIVNAAAAGAVHDALKALPHYHCFEYMDGVQPGQYENGVQCNDLQALTFPDAFCDILITEDVLEHVQNVNAALGEIKRVLKPGGLFLFTVPLQESQPTKARPADHPYHHVDPLRPQGIPVLWDWGSDLPQILAEHGLQAAVLQSHVFYRPEEITDLDADYERGRQLHPYFYLKYNSNVVMAIKQEQPLSAQCLTAVDSFNQTRQAAAERLRAAKLEDTKTKNFVKIYFDRGEGFSEETCEVCPYQADYETYCTVNAELFVPEGTTALRIDPADETACLVRGFTLWGEHETSYSFSQINRDTFSQQAGDVFCTKDPYYVTRWDGKAARLSLCFEIMPVRQAVAFEMLACLAQEKDALIGEERAARAEAEQENARKARMVHELEKKAHHLEMHAEELEDRAQGMEDYINMKNKQYEDTIASTSWKITAPMRFVGRAIRKSIRLFKKGVRSLRVNGVKRTWVLMVTYRARRKESQRFEKIMQENGGTAITYTPYEAEYQDNEVLSGAAQVKALAFYLPQYHTFPENDAWWGKGFTEWVNTKKAEPRFKGHYQPRTPHEDIGYYDLSDVETLKKQAKLAKEHGIFGFCFYYYWFSGKRLMEKPVDMLLEHPEIDINFCLCWANENWTRAWDGQDKEVLMKQDYSEQDDDTFIEDLKKYLDDPRYVRVGGKPVVIVYNPGQIPHVKRTFSMWRQVARQLGIGEILIWTCQTANNTASSLSIAPYVDAEVEFPPHNMWHEFLGVKGLELQGKEAFIYHYQKLVHYLMRRPDPQGGLPVYRSAMMCWDNAARRANGWTTYYGYSLDSYYQWLVNNIQYTKRNFEPGERFTFINAWNEWAEGTYLEPDEKYGYANINTTTRALYGIPRTDPLKVLRAQSPVLRSDRLAQGPRIAVQAHVFYTECLAEIIDNVNAIPYPFDCYFSTNTAEKQAKIQQYCQQHCRAANTLVEVTPNRGRDVAPFLWQLSPVIGNYDYICHLHSKRTSGKDHGDLWRKYLYRNLLGSKEHVERLLTLFEQDDALGLIFPETYPPLIYQAGWGDNEELCKKLFAKLGVDVELPKRAVFPVGNMFWARTVAVRQLFEGNVTVTDFPKEAGQDNYTIAHAIERSWCWLARANGYGWQKTMNLCWQDPPKKTTRLAFFVHFDKKDRLSQSDLRYLEELRGCVDELVFITNSMLSRSALDAAARYADRMITRENRGYDFGAWKQGLQEYGFEKMAAFDEVILANNSCYAPLMPLEHVFAKMEPRNLDFWGMTLFPECDDGSYISKDIIHEHVQSFFVYFSRRVIQSPAFAAFWKNLGEFNNFTDVVANGENELTWQLVQAGFQYGAFAEESLFLPRYLGSYAIPYEKPYELLVLEDPLVKKKCMDHMSPEEDIRIRHFAAQVGKEGWLDESRKG
ncbi:MAG: glycoside hydrolase family 99-like domain-containing protein [Eubacteriales bacterium]|nr:glycoside hydrolase family 99-like domain-containing protein [Eubacteriales bacterium]